MVRISNDGSKTGKSSRIQRRNHAQRLRILSAAAKAFRKQGFSATGVRDIAAAADLSPANLYHYFKGKQELLYFCQDHSLETMLTALRAARRSRESAAGKLRRVIRAHVRCVLDEVEGSTAHLEVHALPPGLRTRLIAKRDEYERGIRALIASGTKSGQFVPCDPKLVANAILGALNWTVRWFRPDGKKSAAEVAEEFASYLVRGLELPSAPDRASDGASAR